MTTKHKIHIFINKEKFSFESSEQTGESIKVIASIPLDHVLLMGHGHYDEQGHCDEKMSPEAKDIIEVTNVKLVTLKNGQHFWSDNSVAGIDVTINLVSYHFDNPIQIGKDIKERAGIDLGDVLFLSKSLEDEVIPNETEIKLQCDDCFYSSPPANYGSTELASVDVGYDQFECVPQPGGWSFLVVPNFSLPKGYSRDTAKLLVKLPPGFPDAAPDMFWISPQVKTQTGGVPQGTSDETLLGEQWQRYSWHLRPQAWRPGISTLRDFMRCVSSRFEHRN